MTEQQFRQPLYREFESLGLFVYILIITDLSAYSNERYERLLLGAWVQARFWVCGGDKELIQRADVVSSGVLNPSIPVHTKGGP